MFAMKLCILLYRLYMCFFSILFAQSIQNRYFCLYILTLKPTDYYARKDLFSRCQRP